MKKLYPSVFLVDKPRTVKLFLHEKKIYLTLLLFTFIVHWRWFSLGKNFFGQDSLIYPQSAYKVFSLGSGTWINFYDLGNSNLQPQQLIFYQFWKVLSVLQINAAIAKQISLLIPIAILSVTSPYLFISKVTGSKHGGFVGAIIYSFATTSIAYQAGEIFLCLAFNLLPLVLYLFDVFLEHDSWKSLLLLVLIFTIQCSIELRVAFLTGFISCVYFICRTCIEKSQFPSWRKFSIGIAIFIILNLYWLQVILSAKGNALTSFTERPIFGSQWTDIYHAVTLSSPFWIQGTLHPFLSGPVPLQNWLLPLLVIFGIYFFQTRKQARFLALKLFALTLAFFGVMESKMENPPFSSFYLLVHRLPGFSLFRTGSEYFMISALGYAIIIGFLVSKSDYFSSKLKNKLFNAFIHIVIVVTIVTNVIPILNGSIGLMFTNHQAPTGFSQMSKIIKTDNSFFRTMWLPATPTWSEYSLLHPETSVLGALNSIDHPRYISEVNQFLPASETIRNSLTSKKFQDAISLYSVKYLIVPPADSKNNGQLFLWYGEPRSYYVSLLNSQSWLKKINSRSGNYEMYLNLNFRNHYFVRATGDASVHSGIINSSVYAASINNYKKTFRSITVGVTFDQGWRAYAVPLKIISSYCTLIKNEISSCRVSSASNLLSTLHKYNGTFSDPHADANDALSFNFRGHETLKKYKDKFGVIFVYGEQYRENILLGIAEIGYLFIILCLCILHVRKAKYDVLSRNSNGL
jgi:hypothetical protein